MSEQPFNNVLNHLIDQAGKTHIFYMNGISTSFDKFEEGRIAIGTTTKLSNSNGSIILPSSIRLESGQYNDSTNWNQAFSSIPGILLETFTNAIGDYIASIDVTQPESFSISNLTTVILQKIYQKMSSVDHIEAFKQFWDDSPSASSSELGGIVGTVQPWLNNNKDSVIFVGHSQGNFFFEDALKTISPQQEQIRVMAFGSPTNYSNAGGLNDLLAGTSGRYRAANIKNATDPVTYFQEGNSQVLHSFLSAPLYSALSSFSPFLNLVGQTLQNLSSLIANSIISISQQGDSKLYRGLSGIAGVINSQKC